MAVDPPAERRASGFRRIRDQRDLRPHVNQRPAGRGVDASGAFLSVRAMLVFFSVAHALTILLFSLAPVDLASILALMRPQWFDGRSLMGDGADGDGGHGACAVVRRLVGCNVVDAAHAAAEAADDEHCGHVPDREPRVQVRVDAQPAARAHQAEQGDAQRRVRQRGLRLYPLRQRLARRRGDA